MNTPEQTVHSPAGEMLRKARRRQRGWISIEVGIGIAAVAIFLIFLGPKIGGIFTSGRAELAFAEITDMILAVEKYRAINGDYDDMTLAVLHDDGYGLPTKGANVYGLTRVAVEESGDITDATVEYTFPDAKTCELFEERVDTFSQIQGVPACNSTDTEKLEFTIE